MAPKFENGPRELTKYTDNQKYEHYSVNSEETNYMIPIKKNGNKSWRTSKSDKPLIL